MRTNTAKENLAKLPEQCFGILPSTGEAIGIVAGDNGYRPQWDGFTAHLIQIEGAKTADEAVDSINASMGVNKAQRKAMENGSMFGWHTKAADPDFWAAQEKAKNEKN